jgi:RibD C-terminal domain
MNPGRRTVDLETEARRTPMSKVIAGITTSIDGYVTGPDDGPGCGLGVGGERLHYRVFGGPRSYDAPDRGDPAPEDKTWLDHMTSICGAVVAGRHLRGGRALGRHHPVGAAVLHRHPPSRRAAAGRGLHLRRRGRRGDRPGEGRRRRQARPRDGRADVIRQALAGGHVDELTVILAPVVLGGGKRLFQGFTGSLDLDQLGVRQSPYATFVDYRVRR